MADHFTSLFERYRHHNDLRALAKLFDAVAPELASVAAHMSRSAEEAEDLVQATFLTAIERSADFDGSRPVVPWLLGILALHARKHRAREGRDLDPERVSQPPVTDPESEAQRREIASAVGSAVEQLDPNYASLVRRHLLDGATSSALAREFELNPITARVRLHRGLKQLRSRLPIGLSLGALGASARFVDLKAVRASVLRRASQITGVAAPAASIASAALVLALLAPVGLAIPAWLLLRTPDATSENVTMVGPESAPEPMVVAHSVPAPLFREAVEVVEPEPASTSNALQGQARVRGRLLLPDASPAAGATVDLGGRVSNSGESFGTPLAWNDPAPMTCGEQGEFDIAFDAPTSHRFWLTAKLEGCAEARWDWWRGQPGVAPQPGEVFDLGDVQLEAAGTLIVRVVNAEGQTLGGDWTVRAGVEPPNREQGRDQTYVLRQTAEANGTYFLENLPARRVTLSAGATNFAKVDDQVIDVIAGASTEVDLIYSGPDPATRIGITVSLPPGVRWTPATEGLSPEHIWLTQPGMPPRHPQVVGSTSSAFVFDDVAPGTYDVHIDDPRLSAWSQTGVEPGAHLRPKLAGKAALSLRILNANHTPYVGHYRLKLVKIGPTISSGVNLVSSNQEPPANGLVGGLLPGDYGFEISFPDHGKHPLVVAGLGDHETREIEIVLAPPAGIQGRVVTGTGSLPMAGVDVQVTLGAVAGHTHGGTGTAHVDGGAIPPLHARTLTDAEGKFSFEGLQPGTWTVRAMFSKWLYVDSTLELPLATPVELVQPPHGHFTGQLLLPVSVPIDDVTLWVTPMMGLSPRPTGLDLTMKRDPAEIAENGQFHLGPIPVGEIDVGLMVYSSSADEMSRTGTGPRLGMFTVLEGTPTPVELDVRATFPCTVHGRVEIDGVAASDGVMRVQALPPLPEQAGIHDSANVLTLTGQFQFGGLLPNTPHRMDYKSATGWSWVLPIDLVFAAGSDTNQVVAITTAQREIQIVDAATGLPLANQRFAWRTGLDYAATVDKPEDLEKASATSDAQGKRNVRLPLGPARFVAMPSGTFTPASVDWAAGTAPIVLRFAPQ